MPIPWKFLNLLDYNLVFLHVSTAFEKYFFLRLAISVPEQLHWIEILEFFGTQRLIFDLRRTDCPTSRDPRTKTGWFRTERSGPTRTDQDQEKIRNLGPNRTRTEKNFKTWDRTRTNKILISDWFGPVSPRTKRSVDPCQRQVTWTLYKLWNKRNVQFEYVQINN